MVVVVCSSVLGEQIQDYRGRKHGIVRSIAPAG